MTGLHFGETGVALAIAEALASGLIEPGPWTCPYYREVFAAPVDWPDLTHGAAGQGLGALACAALLSDDAEIVAAAEACVARCADHLCAAQDAAGGWTLPPGVSEMSGKPYTGLAHGAAGALAFLSQPEVHGLNGAVRAAVERAAAWLLDEARAGEGGLYLWWPMTPDEPRTWSWWCHGGPGIAVGLLACHKATGDGRLAGAVRAALRGQPMEARHANLSQCHGLAGLGEIYLDAHEGLGEDEWLDRAFAIGRVLANLARREKGASWLVENPYVATPDLMVGTAGVVHFLARLARPGSRFGAPLYPAGAVDRAAAGRPA
jgi:lantibiotic modifying enzyme